MTYDHDDPRLTAYALGELDASQFADVQKILDASEEARKYVDEIRLTAQWLARELQKEAEAPPILSLANHRAIDQSLQRAFRSNCRTQTGAPGEQASRSTRRCSSLVWKTRP